MAKRVNTSVSGIGQRYRPERVDALLESSPPDHIVIGSGIGGLCCAASLAKAGRKVLVLEQHYTAGGFTHSYQRHGYEWDVGVHYVGQVGNLQTPPGKLFHWLSEGRLEWDSLGETYDEFIIDQKTYRPPVGKRAYRQYLEELFPAEKNAIRQYCRYLFSVERWLPLFFASKFTFVPGSRRLAGYAQRFVPDAYWNTTGEVFDSLTQNTELRALWSAQWGDLGLPPGQSSFFLHCLIACHYLDGGWYPRGGSSEIARALIPTIQQAGGRVMTYAKVSAIRTDAEGVCGVEMADGHYIPASSVISNCGWQNTQSLIRGEFDSSDIAEVVSEQVTPSACHICLYVGFESSVSELAIPTGNCWVHHSPDFDGDLAEFERDSASPFPFVYISSSSARDSTWSERYPDKSVMEVVSVIPEQEFAQWIGSDWGKRDAEYQARKAYWSDRLLDALYARYPQLKGRVSYCELSTPLSTQHFMNYQQGEIYGLAHTPQRYQQQGLKPKTQIPGLYLTGQDALTSGVAGAAMSGVLSAAETLGAAYMQQFKALFSASAARNQSTTFGLRWLRNL